jgi:uncharacterized protein DUF3327/putative esterase
MNRRSVNAIAVTIAGVMTIGHPMVATAPQAKNNSEAVSTLIDALRRSRAIGDRGAEDRFWRRVAADGAPLIEPYKGSYLVSFVWHGDSQTHNVVVFSQIGGADPAANKMAHVDGTDVWFRTYVLPRRARLTYRLSPNDSLLPLTAPNLDIVQRLSTTRLDPLNPHHFPPRGDVTNPETVSLVEMPDAPSQQFVTPRPNTPRGNLTDVQFTSEVLGNTRSVHVYTPTGYAADAEPYASLVMFDGESYVKLVSAPTILDNLINDRTIPPTVAVFVDNAAGPAARPRASLLSTLCRRDRERTDAAPAATVQYHPRSSSNRHRWLKLRWTSCHLWRHVASRGVRRRAFSISIVVVETCRRSE